MILSRAITSFSVQGEKYVELPLFRSGMYYFVGKTTADPESKLLLKLGKLLEGEGGRVHQ